jgi:hypothetical protein
VKAFTRILCLAFVAMGMLGVTGCGEDNATEGAKQAAKEKNPGAPDPKGLPGQTVTPPKDNAGRNTMGPQGSQIMQGKKPGETDKAKPASK